jgi:glycosyltransferase involved in cell wall biosynthesis
MKPLISVIIPTRNAEKFIREAVESIILQSYSHLQILILDDASSDGTLNIVEKLADPRIEIYRSSVNKGQSYQLNLGIAYSRGDYISIMHADDVAKSDKLEKQLGFLNDNPEVGICGCHVNLIGDKEGLWTYPLHNRECKDMLLNSVPFAHPAVLFRKSVLEKIPNPYDPEMVAAEDYDLWVRLAGTTEFGNLQEPLLNYRIHSQQLSQVRKVQEDKAVFEIRTRLIGRFFRMEDKEQILAAVKAVYYPKDANIAQVIASIALLWRQNKKFAFFTNSFLRGRFRHLLFEAFSQMPLSKRVKLLFSSKPLLEITYPKTLLRLLVLK